MYSDISDFMGHDLEGIEAGVKKGKWCRGENVPTLVKMVSSGTGLLAQQRVQDSTVRGTCIPG